MNQIVSCKSCGAPIFYVASERGNNMPLNSKPEKRVVLTNEAGYLVKNASEVSVGRVVDVYISHFATCPNANKHRRPHAVRSHR